jgi:hypothetical protein
MDAAVRARFATIRSSSRRFDTPQRFSGDEQLQIQLAKQEVIARDVANERHEHAAARLFAGQCQRDGRFVLPADAAKDIELPRQLEPVHPRLMRRVVLAGLIVGIGRLADAVARGGSHLGVQIGLRDASAGSRLLDAGDGGPQIEVVLNRLTNERLQRRIVEDLEPLRVGHRLRLLAVDEAVFLGRRQLGPGVIRAERAPDEQQRHRGRQQKTDDGTPHLSVPRARGRRPAAAARPPKPAHASSTRP